MTQTTSPPPTYRHDCCAAPITNGSACRSYPSPKQITLTAKFRDEWIVNLTAGQHSWRHPGRAGRSWRRLGAGIARRQGRADGGCAWTTITRRAAI